MIRSFTMPPISGGQTINFPKQPTPFRVISCAFQLTVGGILPTNPQMNVTYAEVALVGLFIGTEIPVSQQCYVTFAQDVDTWFPPSSSNNFAQTIRIPPLIILPEMSLEVGWLGGNLDESTTAINWLIEDIGERRRR